MIGYYYLTEVGKGNPVARELNARDFGNAIVQACNLYNLADIEERREYNMFIVYEVDKDDKGWLGVLKSFEFILDGEPVYYFPDEDYSYYFFGRQKPVCVSACELVRLLSEWSQDWNCSIEEYLKSIHVASKKEITLNGTDGNY